jgi:AcrR family transcriptional regulator
LRKFKTVGRPKTNADTPDTRTMILEITEQLLERTGFAGTSMEAVSLAAGITKGTLYYHFTSKDELITTMLHGVLDRERKITQAALANAQTARAQLEAMAVLSFSRQQHTQRIMMMVTDAQRFLPAHLWQELFARFMSEAHAPLENIMKFGIENQEFEPHDTQFSAWAFMGLLSQLAEPQISVSKPNMVQELLDFVIHGIGKKVNKAET